MVRLKVRIPRIALAGALLGAVAPVVPAQPAAAAPPKPGAPLLRSDNTPFAPSSVIVGARWTSQRFDPPGNQWGDILPTVWSDDGGTYVLMDDGGVDVPVQGGLWRQSFARVTGKPPNLHFQRIGDPSATPPARTWSQIGSNPDNDDGPLGPYYSIGFVEVDGVFYATLERNWNWNANGLFSGLAGMAYSRDHGRTWHVVKHLFGAPLGNLNFIDGGGPGGAHPDGYVYAIGTEREFNASGLLLGRVRPGVSNLTNPARWQWFGGFQRATRSPIWVSSPAAATSVISWSSHMTYPQMTYDAPLHRYLVTFTYSYSPRPPGVWTGGAELVILEAPSPLGPFSFVARSGEFGPSNGYGAGFPSQWISSNGRDLWLKWAANFSGCAKGLDCSGKYGYNIAKVHLTVVPQAKPASAKPASAKPLRKHIVYVLSASALLLLAIGIARRVRLGGRESSPRSRR
jgi:hypothetical protein